MPVKNLKVAVVPVDIRQDDKSYNLTQVEERLRSFDRDIDLVVLPEMFTTGFTQDAGSLDSLAETNSGETMQTVRRWASEGRFAIWGSFIARTGSGLYNRGFMIEPSGDENYYDKRHLFSIGGEDRLLKGGCSDAPVVRYRGWNLKMAICYDLRFPVWLRNRNLTYDALIVPANWPDKRGYAWRQLLSARAIENQCYVIGANRDGSDLYGEYSKELTCAFDFRGKEIGERASDGILYVTFDATGLTTDRERFAPWRDADDFDIVF